MRNRISHDGDLVVPAKKEVRPLSAVSYELVDSMERARGAALSLYQAVSSAIELGGVSERVKPILERELAKFREAFIGDE